MREKRQKLLLREGDHVDPTGGSSNNYFREERARNLSAGDVSLYDEVNFCISDTDLDKLTKTSCKVRSFISFEKKMTQEEFEFEVNKLYKCCLKSVKDLHELHLRRIAGMQILNDIIRRTDPSYIDITHVIHMTWAIMSCIHHFQLRLRSGASGLVQYARRKKTESCNKSYSKFIRLFKPSMYRLILNAIIIFYKEGELWDIEFACTDLIVDLLCMYEDVEVAINDIISNAEHASLYNVTEAKQLIQVLYEVLEKVEWRRMSKTLMKRFLDILESSIVPKTSDEFNYAPLRTGLQICIRNILDNLHNRDLMILLGETVKRMTGDNVNAEMIQQLGYNIASYAATKCTFKVFYKKVPRSLLTVLGNLTRSKNILQVSAAIRIWQSIIDRNNIGSKFMPPRIYFQDTTYKFKVKKCHPDNKHFYKIFRVDHFETCMNLWRSVTNRRTLEDIYKCQATLLTEIPCGLTASTYATIAMGIQEYALSISKTDLVRSHHLHAIVLSLMSLICYVHKSKVFFEYVTTIMERRAEWAPHLNPPLKEKYTYAQHHILWNKPDLFFEDWEVRYGLWKCFRVEKKQK